MSTLSRPTTENVVRPTEFSTYDRDSLDSLVTSAATPSRPTAPLSTYASSAIMRSHLLADNTGSHSSGYGLSSTGSSIIGSKPSADTAVTQAGDLRLYELSSTQQFAEYFKKNSRDGGSRTESWSSPMPDTKAEIQVVTRATASCRTAMKSISQVEQEAFAQYGRLATLSDFIEDDHAAQTKETGQAVNKTRGSHRTRSRNSRRTSSTEEEAYQGGGRGSARAIVATLAAYERNSLNNTITEEWTGEGTNILEILTKDGLLGLERAFLQAPRRRLSLPSFLAAVTAQSTLAPSLARRAAPGILDLFEAVDSDNTGYVTWAQLTDYLADIGAAATISSTPKDGTTPLFRVSPLCSPRVADVPITKALYSPALGHVTTLDGSDRIAVYHERTLGIAHTLRSPAGPLSLMTLASSGRNKYLLCGGTSGKVSVHDASNNYQLSACCEGEEDDGISAVNSAFLSTSSTSAPALRLAHTLALSSCLTALHFDSHSSLLFSSSATHTDLSCYTLARRFAGTGSPPAVAATRQGTVLAHTDVVCDILGWPEVSFPAVVTASMDTTVRVWDIERAAPVHTLTAHRTGVCMLDRHPDYGLLLSAGHDRGVHLWSSGGTHAAFLSSAHSLKAICAIPGTSQLVTADVGGVVQVWDVRTMNCLQTIPAENGKGQSLASVGTLVSIPGKGRLLLGGTRLYAWESGETGSGAAEEEGADTSLTMSVIWDGGSGNIITTAHNRVKMWDGSNGNLSTVHSVAAAREITAASVCVGGRKVLLGDHAGGVYALDTATGKTLRSRGGDGAHGGESSGAAGTGTGRSGSMGADVEDTHASRVSSTSNGTGSSTALSSECVCICEPEPELPIDVCVPVVALAGTTRGHETATVLGSVAPVDMFGPRRWAAVRESGRNGHALTHTGGMSLTASVGTSSGTGVGTGVGGSLLSRLQAPSGHRLWVTGTLRGCGGLRCGSGQNGGNSRSRTRTTSAPTSTAVTLLSSGMSAADAVAPNASVLLVHALPEANCVLVVTARGHIRTFAQPPHQDTFVLLRETKFPSTSCASVCPLLSLVALGGHDGCVRLWDYRTHVCVGEISGHAAEISCLSFLAPFPLLLSADVDGLVCVSLVRPVALSSPLIRWVNTSVLDGVSASVREASLLHRAEQREEVLHGRQGGSSTGASAGMGTVTGSAGQSTGTGLDPQDMSATFTGLPPYSALHAGLRDVVDTGTAARSGGLSTDAFATNGTADPFGTTGPFLTSVSVEEPQTQGKGVRSGVNGFALMPGSSSGAGVGMGLDGGMAMSAGTGTSTGALIAAWQREVSVSPVLCMGSWMEAAGAVMAACGDEAGVVRVWDLGGAVKRWGLLPLVGEWGDEEADAQVEVEEEQVHAPRVGGKGVGAGTGAVIGMGMSSVTADDGLPLSLSTDDAAAASASTLSALSLHGSVQSHSNARAHTHSHPHSQSQSHSHARATMEARRLAAYAQYRHRVRTQVDALAAQLANGEATVAAGDIRLCRVWRAHAAAVHSMTIVGRQATEEELLNRLSTPAANKRRVVSPTRVAEPVSASLASHDRRSGGSANKDGPGANVGTSVGVGVVDGASSSTSTSTTTSTSTSSTPSTLQPSITRIRDHRTARALITVGADRTVRLWHPQGFSLGQLRQSRRDDGGRIADSDLPRSNVGDTGMLRRDRDREREKESQRLRREKEKDSAAVKDWHFRTDRHAAKQMRAMRAASAIAAHTQATYNATTSHTRHADVATVGGNTRLAGESTSAHGLGGAAGAGGRSLHASVRAGDQTGILRALDLLQQQYKE